MSLKKRVSTCGCLLLCVAAMGCQSAPEAVRGSAPRGGSAASASRGTPARGNAQPLAPTAALSEIRSASLNATDNGNHRATVASAVQAAMHRAQRPITADELFQGERELQFVQLLSEVLARNQTLRAMRAAWLAAAERYPQARALDDPVFTGMMAPASLNSAVTSVPGNTAGYVVGGAQKLPWFGKRQLRGAAALDESFAARWDVEDARLSIIEAAGLAYYDYYLSRQEQSLNMENTARLRQFHEIAARRYEANLAPRQDVLQAEVELADLARRRLELERLERIAIARINTLMHRPPDAFLPAAPARLHAPVLVLSATELRREALARRPDLAALAAKMRAEQARLRLAEKEFMPDVEVFGRYDNFWTQASQRGQVGLNMNVPLYRDKRYAAVRETQWRLSQRRAEYQQRIDDINREVQTAFEQFDEAQQTVGLYTERILPAAEENVSSALAAYETGRGDFLRLVAAQRQFITLKERYQESIADYHRRRLALERAVGAPLNRGAQLESLPPP